MKKLIFGITLLSAFVTTANAADMLSRYDGYMDKEDVKCIESVYDSKCASVDQGYAYEVSCNGLIRFRDIDGNVHSVSSGFTAVSYSILYNPVAMSGTFLARKNFVRSAISDYGLCKK